MKDVASILDEMMKDMDNIVDEMLVLDKQLEGLWMTLSCLKTNTAEGIIDAHEVRGTISALEDMAEIYYNKYSDIFEAVTDWFKETSTSVTTEN